MALWRSLASRSVIEATGSPAGPEPVDPVTVQLLLAPSGPPRW
jgi:hypothetical protein